MAEKEQVSLKLLVDKKNNRVLSAEAGKDFVDALFSFLTLPLGTIVRIVKKDSNLKPVRIGSLSSLYQSVADLEEKHFSTEDCKEMLLWPRSSMESHQNPKLNIEDTEPIKYFVCQKLVCVRKKSGGFLSTFKNKLCNCGELMNREIGLGESLLSERNKGYVNELAVFTVSDDLKVNPILEWNIVGLCNRLGIEDMQSIEKITVNVDPKEMLDLLKFSLTSKTPLTDLFLQKKEAQKDSIDLESLLPLEIGTIPEPTENIKCMKVKVVLQKSKNKVLFAHVEEDLADFLLSFLTLPLGAVLNLLEGNSGLNCLDNLFKSLSGLHIDRHLRSEESKKVLIKPQIASKFKFQNMILPIDEATAPNYSCFSNNSKYNFQVCLSNLRDYSCYQFSSEVYAPLTLLDSNSSRPRGSLKGVSCMVTDDLILTPFSCFVAASLLNESNIPLLDLEERVITIGPKEGLSILRASLISSSTLTLGLRPFIERTTREVMVKEEY